MDKPQWYNSREGRPTPLLPWETEENRHVFTDSCKLLQMHHSRHTDRLYQSLFWELLYPRLYTKKVINLNLTIVWDTKLTRGIPLLRLGPGPDLLVATVAQLIRLDSRQSKAFLGTHDNNKPTPKGVQIVRGIVNVQDQTSLHNLPLLTDSWVDACG